MPLFEATNPKNNENTNPTDNPTNSPVASKGLFSLPDSVMKLVPWIPFVLEATTGQKIPQLGGTMGEIQTVLTQLQLTQTQILTQQQQLSSRLIALETKWSETQTKLSEIQTNANQHLTNLTHQFNSLRLTHTREKEKKSIEYNPPLEKRGVHSEFSLKEQNPESEY